MGLVGCKYFPSPPTKKPGDYDNFCACGSQENFKKKSDFKWPKPEGCPGCHSHRLWGHGFVSRFFDGFSEALLMRRYRCPDCGTVITMRPRGYLPRFQAPLAITRKSILDKHYRKCWSAGIGRTRQRLWWNAFCRRQAAIWGNLFLFPVQDLFDALVRAGLSPVGRSI
jgi:hypothetical protein